VEFIRKPGEPPFLHFLNAAGERVETIDLEPLSRDQCNEALVSRGFYRKKELNDPVPEEFKEGPYRRVSGEL
jgi:predicted ATPase